MAMKTGPTSMERTRNRDEEPTSPVNERKKQKIGENDDRGTHVGATELASAMALASLALSPGSTSGYHAIAETRDADIGDDEQSAASLAEIRSPKEDPIPVTPDARSPIRYNLKKVTFAPDTQTSERTTCRRYALPPRINRDHGSRLPPKFRRCNYAGRPQFPMHWMHQASHRLVGPAVAFFPPPPMMPTQSNQWICDFCNIASFATFNEACLHEETCAARHMSQNLRRDPMWQPLSPQSMPIMQPSLPPAFAGSQDVPKALPSSKSRKWYTGSTFLSVPESDSDWLSELNCFIRSSCVEAFSADEENVNRASKRGRITLKQVGIRCCFCKGRPIEERAVAAISFPTSVAGIYESVKRWQRVHLEVCEDVPAVVRENIQQLAMANVWIPTTRQYWADSARAVGMVDTEDGIRFAVDPARGHDGALEAAPNTEEKSSFEDSTDHNDAKADGKSIVFPEDISAVPPYVFFLMSQVESCRFSEADRFVARSKGPVGYPGFQCRHCNGHAGLGKYFPVSSKSLATNSTSQNIHAHLLKCRKCPPALKRQLVSMKEEKSKAPRLVAGWRKVFFDKVWARLHESEL